MMLEQQTLGKTCLPQFLRLIFREKHSIHRPRLFGIGCYVRDELWKVDLGYVGRRNSSAYGFHVTENQSTLACCKRLA